MNIYIYIYKCIASERVRERFMQRKWLPKEGVSSVPARKNDTSPRITLVFPVPGGPCNRVIGNLASHSVPSEGVGEESGEAQVDLRERERERRDEERERERETLLPGVVIH